METRIATQTGMETRIATVAVYKAVRSATHSSNVLSTTYGAWLPCSTTTTCSTRTLEHGVSITKEGLVAAHVPSCTCTCKRHAPSASASSEVLQRPSASLRPASPIYRAAFRRHTTPCYTHLPYLRGLPYQPTSDGSLSTVSSTSLSPHQLTTAAARTT